MESSRLFKRVDDPSYSELEEHVGGAFRADGLDGFEQDEYYVEEEGQGADRRGFKGDE